MTAAAVEPMQIDGGVASAKEAAANGSSNSPTRVLPEARDKARHDAKYDKKKSKGKDVDGKDGGDSDKEGEKEGKRKLTPLERCEKKIRAAKRATRSELSVTGGEWQKHGYAYDAKVLSPDGIGDDIERISAKEVSVEEFIERFERPCRPCLITDAMDGWTANTEWTYDKLRAKFGKHKFKVGSDDDGYAVRLKFNHIHHYVNDPAHMRDDSPLYIFDGSFGDKEGSQPLLKDYEVPKYFKEDLFRHVGEKRRPPYRWVVIGPPRSGSSVHVDPLATSAWNALISGHKRWALYPPDAGLTKPDLKPKGMGLDGESVTWFQRMYPKTRGAAWTDTRGFPRPMDCVQGPGEIMYVPDGWWHAVLNLDHTVAVTQNVVTTARFPRAWRMTKRGRPKMSNQWLRKLREKRPDLAAAADAQPRRAETSANEKTSSSSSSSSSEESSDTEPDTNDPAFVDANAAAMKLNRLFLGSKGGNGTPVSDATLMEMARERKARVENEPASPKKKRTE